MQRARVEEHGEVGVDGDAAQTGHVRGGVAVEAGAFHPLGHEDGVADQVFHHGGGADGVQAAGAHGLLELDGVLGLQPATKREKARQKAVHTAPAKRGGASVAHR